MRVRIKTWLPAALGAVAFFGLAGAAVAQSCGSTCQPPPTVCCEPPPPPPPPPPTECCEGPQPPDNPPDYPPDYPPGYPPPGGNININVNVNANANASAGARAGINARAGNYGNLRGGGGGAYFSVDQPSPTVIHGLNVEASAGTQVVRVPYQAVRRTEKRVVIQAFCIDDRNVPHPASQVTPDREISDSYEGEIYRCIAGTRLHITWAEWSGQVRFDHGETYSCQKGEALWRDRGGDVRCRVQRHERDCNERSLLRRYGAGIKILVWIREETYTEYREEVVQTAGSSVVGATLMLDGGVGGRVF